MASALVMEDIFSQEEAAAQEIKCAMKTNANSDMRKLARMRKHARLIYDQNEFKSLNAKKTIESSPQFLYMLYSSNIIYIVFEF